MKIDEIKKALQTQEYSFLRENEHLQSKIILLGIGGSHAYGTNTETSDLDVRGVALRSKREILTGHGFEQVENRNTDTVIYSFDKILSLLSNCNPNVIELVGLKPEHYLYLNPVGELLLRNKKLFLSKKATQSFGGYANAQLRRLDNKAVRTVEQAARERHILNSILNAANSFPERYFEVPEDSIRLYIDKAVQEGYDTEIFMDVNLTRYPLRDYKAMWSEMHNIVKDYGKIGSRNSKAIEHGKLGKHMMHLVRLYLMCFDILEKEEIVTYREIEHDFLMDIRNGKYLDENNQPIPEFYDIVNEYEKRLEYDKENTSLPEKPDYKKIEEFHAAVNEMIVQGEW